MIRRGEIIRILEEYSFDNISIGAIGSHSALDISSGAKKYGFRSVVVCQKGREKTYIKYYKRRVTLGEAKGCIDKIFLLDKFRDMIKEDIQTLLRGLNTIFVPSRSFMVYVGYDAIENVFRIPLFGNRLLLRAEERDVDKNQYYLLDKAGIRRPLEYKSYEEIDRISIVKVSESERKYERAFFFVSSPREYEEISEKLIRDGKINREALEKATIEEFILGAQFNFNFFYSPLTGELELIGIDTRRQTNLEGLIRLPAEWQLKLGKRIEPKFIETGHIACTLRESLLEKVFEYGERLIETVKREYPPGIIGPFALQGAVIPGPPKEDIVIFDVSFRVPGSPGTPYTPYTFYLWGRNISVGERIAMEIMYGIKENRLEELVT